MSKIINKTQLGVALIMAFGSLSKTFEENVVVLNNILFAYVLLGTLIIACL